MRLESLGAVHTHTHTHTGQLENIKNKIEINTGVLYQNVNRHNK